MIRMKYITVIVLCSMFLLPVTAFSSWIESENEKTVLRIATIYGDERNGDIHSKYTDLYEIIHENMEIEVENAIHFGALTYFNPSLNPLTELKKLLQSSHPPDVLMVDYASMSTLIEEDLLQPLDEYIVEDEFDLEGMADIVIERLREAGNGQLYGLAPTFSSYALAYNKDLFREAGVSFPHDGMTWEEVFELAEQFVDQGTETDPIFGFAFSPHFYYQPSDHMRLYVNQLDLNMVDENMESMLVNTPQWEQVWTTMIRLFEENIIPDQDYWMEIMANRWDSFDPFASHTLLSGNVAMILVHYYDLNYITYAMHHADMIEQFEKFDWDVVSMPYQEENPHVGGEVVIDPIFVIPANAIHTEEAWDFIQFINGEQWAQLKAKSTYDLLSREKYNQPLYGDSYHLNAFLQTKAAKVSSSPSHRMDDLSNIRNIGDYYFEQVMEGNLTVQEALHQWEDNGNIQLQNLKW